MTQQAKQYAANPPSRKHQPSFQHGERESVDNLLHVADDVNRATAEGMDICSDTIGALVESGNAASRVVQDITGEMLGSCNRALSDFMGISREAFACRTINDMVELQHRASPNAYIIAM